MDYTPLAVGSGEKIPKASQGFQNDSLMDIEYEDLLKKVMEHQAEIEEAEKLLHVQKAKHEADKQNMIEQFKAEKANMEQLINQERGSMENAMQNLINEIVRLKEERNEIRKNNRVEKEKLVLAFENERAAWLSSTEDVKNEIEEKLEKKFLDDFEKVKKEMTSRETELKEEMVKLKEERHDLVCDRVFLLTVIKRNKKSCCGNCLRTIIPVFLCFPISCLRIILLISCTLLEYYTVFCL